MGAWRIPLDRGADIGIGTLLLSGFATIFAALFVAFVGYIANMWGGTTGIFIGGVISFIGYLLVAHLVFAIPAVIATVPFVIFARLFGYVGWASAVTAGATFGAITGCFACHLVAYLPDWIMFGMFAAIGIVMGAFYAAIFWLTVRRLAPDAFADRQ